MRIETGNFGNNQRQAASTQVNRGDVTALADAKVNVARQQQQNAQQVGQAFGRLAQQMTGVGEEMEQRQTQLAQQKAALVVQQKTLFAQGVLQEAQDQVDAGTLKSADVQKYYNDSMSKFSYEDISGLHGQNEERFKLGLGEVDQRMSGDVKHLYRAAHKVETRAAVDEMISNTERLTLNGGDITKSEQLYDSETFQANAREAYGAGYKQKIIEAKGSLYKNHAQNAILNARDSYSGLNAIQEQLTGENGMYRGKLDADTQIQLMSQVESRKGTLEAKAEAARARAEAATARAENRRIAADNKAQAATLHMREFIAAGNVPDDKTIEEYQAVTQGTSYQADGTSVMKLSTATQAFSAQPIAVQEQQLTAMAAQMKAGTNPDDVQVYKALVSAHDTQKKQLIEDPVVAIAERSGAEIAPLPWDAISSAKAPADVKAANQQFAAAIYSRAALTAQARGQTREAPDVVLTAQERADTKAYADGLPDNQRAAFYKTIGNAGGKYGLKLVKEISGSDVVTAAAYHGAASPNSPTSAMIVRGDQMLNDKKSNYSAPKTKDTQAAIDDAYSGAVPASQRSTLANTVNAHYMALRTQKGQNPNEYDADDYKESMSAVIGDTVNYGKTKIVVPAGTDANQFRNVVYGQLNELPGGANAIGRLETGQAGLTAVGAKRYMLTTPGGGAYFDPQSGQPITIEIP